MKHPRPRPPMPDTIHGLSEPVPGEDRVRLTISVTPEVHAAFVRYAKAGGVSLSRAMGDWLADTLDAVEYTASLMEKARAAPKAVMRELHAYALGLADETGVLLEKVRAKGAAAAGATAPAGGVAAGEPLTPPVSNTGGKVPRKGGSGPGRERRGGG